MSKIDVLDGKSSLDPLDSISKFARDAAPRGNNLQIYEAALPKSGYRVTILRKTTIKLEKRFGEFLCRCNMSRKNVFSNIINRANIDF